MKNRHKNWKIFAHRKGDNQQYIPQIISNALQVRGRIVMVIFTFFSILATSSVIFPIITVQVASSLITILSLIEVCIIMQPRNKHESEKHYIQDLEKLTNFPLYTIIVPIFMEKPYDIIKLRNNLQNLKYPNIEIIYIIEEIDLGAMYTFDNIELQHNEKYIQIPRIAPFTKPKACNYALEFARGKYVVIYDIEDKPHPYQLHFAHSFFSQNKNASCLQFPLEFTQCYTIYEMWQKIDYIRWYGCMLDTISKFKIPIPLGGTSNHFVTKDLRMAGGWDSYNVTEDAELGLRLFALGYGVRYCNVFATSESPVKNIANLYNQRTRWAKGHLITTIQVGKIFMQNKNYYAFLAIIYMLASRWLIFSFSMLLLVFGILNDQIFQNHYIATTTCVNIFLFLSIPLQLLLIKKMRHKKMIPAILTYNIFYIFYFVVLAKALTECVNRPFAWYKTLR